jgi:L-threonylcarbamoyladenylate synthase
MAEKLADLPEEFTSLADAFWPGPLTLIVPKKPLVSDLVTAGKPTVAVRMPRHPVAHALLELTGQPLAAPSANPFGYVSPSTAQHVADSFGQAVPFIIDGGPCQIGLESTILDLSEPGHLSILRPGAISAEDLEAVLGKPVRLLRESPIPGEGALAPGTFPRHYSPKAAVQLFAHGTRPAVPENEAVIYLKRPASGKGDRIFWLSENGDPATVAQTLFSLLRRVDAQRPNAIHCELPDPDQPGLATAITDRLVRAAANKTGGSRRNRL